MDNKEDQGSSLLFVIVMEELSWSSLLFVIVMEEASRMIAAVVNEGSYVSGHENY